MFYNTKEHDATNVVYRIGFQSLATLIPMVLIETIEPLELHFFYFHIKHIIYQQTKGENFTLKQYFPFQNSKVHSKYFLKKNLTFLHRYF